MFVQPYQVKTKFKEALHAMISKKKDKNAENAENSGVCYFQKQNDCFRTDYFALDDDINDDVVHWGEEVFGEKVDCVNFWCGPDE